MITILNGKLTIPESERFIGFAGDNFARTIEYVICGKSELDRIYRLYLTFDDGTVNYFVLPSQLTDEGVLLTWDVQTKHIYKSGNVRAQIKAFSGDGVVYHTTTDTFIVGNSAEFSDETGNINSEFLEYEERLNNIANTINEVCVLMPYIGENGNWYIYNSETGEYEDSGKPSVMEIENHDIADGAVTSSKLAQGSLDREELFSEEMRSAFLSLPMKTISVAGGISDDYYNSFTQPGVYQIDSYSGVHRVLIVLKPNSDAYLMQILLSYNQILFRGIWCTVEGVYADDDWEGWKNLTTQGMDIVEKFMSVSALDNSVDPEILAYQTSDPTTNSLIRVPLSLVLNREIEDEGEYFVSNTVEGALQELGAELQGVSQLLSEI